MAKSSLKYAARSLWWAFLALVLSAPSGSVQATEFGAGRYIPGVFAGPGAGIVPPFPGVYWLSQNFFYEGSAGADAGIPRGGQLGLELDTLSLGTTFTALFVPKLDLGNLTYAFAASLPLQYNETTGKAELGPFSRSRTDDLFSLGDIAITPVLLGWHSGTHFVSAGLTIFAPTGEFDPDTLALVGLNYWTFSPSLAYTYIDPKLGLDFSAKAGLDLNTENEETDYRSGAMAHLDVSLTKNLTEQFGVGVFGAVLYQIEDDEGGLADRLDGFRGRSFAIGPLVKYTAKTPTTEVNFSLSWAPEFGVERRLEGNAVYLNGSGKF